MKDYEFITKILNTKFSREDPNGSLHMPIYENVAFEFKNAEELEAAFKGQKPGHLYSRITNPTIEHFERKIASVTGAIGVLALSSGMAAISNLIIAIAEKGDNIITSKHLFGNTYSLFSKTLSKWGLEIKYTDLTNEQKVRSLVDEKTVAIFLETITNPQMEVASLSTLKSISKDNGLLLIADTTLTPPYLFESKKHGVDIEVLSSTKYISGGATTVGGLIIDNGTYDWKLCSKLSIDAKKIGPYTLINRLRTEVYRNLGACLSPHNAFMQSLGLETLPLRIDASCANTIKIAKYLEESKEVKSVNYPGLKTSKYYDIAKKHFGNKFGGLLTFDLNSKKDCFRFMNNLKIIRRATNLNDNRTLILHPSSTIFCEYDDELKKEMGIRDTMIRLSVGIEGIDDLINDIKNALEVLG